MEKINLKQKLSLFTEHWQPKIISEYNGNELRVVKLSGEFVWHDHAESDEIFLIIEGHLTIHFRDKVVELDPGELIVIPAGVEHKPVAEGECHALVIDREGTVNTGATGGERTVENLERI